LKQQQGNQVKSSDRKT